MKSNFSWYNSGMRRKIMEELWLLSVVYPLYIIVQNKVFFMTFYTREIFFNYDKHVILSLKCINSLFLFSYLSWNLEFQVKCSDFNAHIKLLRKCAQKETQIASKSTSHYRCITLTENYTQRKKRKFFQRTLATTDGWFVEKSYKEKE